MDLKSERKKWMKAAIGSDLVMGAPSTDGKADSRAGDEFLEAVERSVGREFIRVGGGERSWGWRGLGVEVLQLEMDWHFALALMRVFLYLDDYCYGITYLWNIW